MSKSIVIIQEIEGLLEALKKEMGVMTNNVGKKVKINNAQKIYSGLTGDIFNLVQENFFKTPRTLSEIQNKLRLEGVIKPTTSLMKPLLLLVRKKIIGRIDDADGKGPYKYYKR